MVDIPTPDFDFEDEISFSFDASPLGSPPLTPQNYIIQVIESFGFNVQLKNPLRCTSNSMVFSSEIPYSNDLYALKISTNRQRIINEYENSNKIKECPYLVKYYDLYDADTSVFLQMELCTDGDITCKKMDENIFLETYS